MAALRRQHGELVDRDRDVLLVANALEQVQGGPISIVITGEAGIGKTAVWQHALALAEERGFRVLSTRSGETESTFAFAGLIDLFAHVTDDEILPWLPRPQAGALRAALLRSDEEVVPSANLVAVASLSALRALAEEIPLVIAVDDLQWLDEPTANVLAYALRRLKKEPVALLAAVRSGESVAEPLVAALRGHADAELELRPLSPEAVAGLLRRDVDSGMGRATVDRIAHAAGGNPFYALELARALRGEDPRDPTRPLRVPRNLRTLVAARLEDLSQASREAVLATFALSRPTVALVRAALAAAKRSSRGLDDAVEAKVLVLHEDTILLAHPLLGSVLYEELPEPRRRALHSRLAELPIDPEERARHLALSTTGTSESVAGELEVAAKRARARGSPGGAAELLALALRLTPPEKTLATIRRSFAVAIAEYAAGSADSARLRWRKLADEAAPGPVRASALWHLAQFLAARTAGEMEELLRQALAEAGDDADLHARIHMTFSRTAWWAGRPRDGARHAAKAIELAEGTGNFAVLAGALAQAAQIAVLLGEDVRTDLLERAIQLEREHGDALPLEVLATLARPIIADCIDDDLDLVREEFLAARTLAEQRGDEPALAQVATYLCDVECRRGDWAAAARHAEEANELVEQAGAIQIRGKALQCLALVDALEGRIGSARERALAALAYDDPTGFWPVIARDRRVLAFLELSTGRHEEALAWLRPIDDLMKAEAFGEPALFRHLPDQIEALVHLGRVDEAEAYLAPWEREAQRLGRKVALGGALRGRALVLAARCELDGAAQAAHRSAELFEEMRRPFEHGRSLLVLGTIERRRRRSDAAASALARARSVFEELGAPLWAEKARVVVKVRVLGRFEVVENGQPLEVPAGKPAQLVKLVACSGGRLHAEEAIEALWPETEPAAGRKALRNTLSRLRSVGTDLVVRDDEALVSPPATRIDAAEFDAASAAAFAQGATSQGAQHARDAIALYTGDLLLDDPYESWAASPRERLRNRYLALLDLLAREAEARVAIDEALGFLERGIETDPLGEERYLRAARLLLADGKRLRAASMLRRGEQVFELVGVPVPTAYRELAHAVLPSGRP